MPRRVSTVAGSLCWISGLQWFVGQAITQAAWRTPYSLSYNFVSDLGAVHCGTQAGPGYVCSPLHTLMNASFILIGIATVCGVLLLGNRWPRSRFVTVGLLLVLMFGLGKVVVGLAPEDESLFVHSIGGLGILVGNIGCILLAVGLWHKEKPIAVVFLCVGVVGVVGFGLFLIPALVMVRGALERLADWPLPLWLAVLGAFFLAGRGPLRLARPS